MLNTVYLYTFKFLIEKEEKKPTSASLPGPPENITFSPNMYEFHPLETITCTADGNPEIEHYTWSDVTNTTDLKKNELLQEGKNASVLEISEKWKWAGDLTLRCTARNTIQGEEYFLSEDIVVTVTGKLEDCKMLAIVTSFPPFHAH